MVYHKRALLMLMSVLIKSLIVQWIHQFNVLICPELIYVACVQLVNALLFIIDYKFFQCKHNFKIKGYTGNGHYCTDVNECENNNGGCSTSPSVQCINTRVSPNN